jgi:hypothetical protein
MYQKVNLNSKIIVFRHKEVCKKSPEDICAKIDDHGEVKFYKTVPTTNRLSR